MKYRVRYSVWIIEASSPAEAKKKVCGMLKKDLEALVSIEPFANTRPIWLRLLTGK